MARAPQQVTTRGLPGSRQHGLAFAETIGRPNEAVVSRQSSLEQARLPRSLKPLSIPTTKGSGAARATSATWHEASS